jgi:DNA-binding SARP family transcriptional activator
MTNSLAINMLGELQMLAGDTEVPLPPSRKTRALLAYLASTGDVVRRDRLCEIFWDIPDDPKGALRWSLSKIRGVLGEDEKARLHADRESIKLDTNGLASDVCLVRDAVTGGLGSLDASRLRALANTFRGEFLEGLDLPKHHVFHSWAVN